MRDDDYSPGVCDEFYKSLTMLVQDRLDGDVTAASNILKVSVETIQRWMSGGAAPHWQVQDAVLRKLRSQGWAT